MLVARFASLPPPPPMRLLQQQSSSATCPAPASGGPSLSHAPTNRLPAGALHHLQHFGSMSRTLQYKKITKPLLERKRRARINRCLDELKELMVSAFEAEGENVNKLEKADILELTVRHLHKLHEAGRLAPASPEGPDPEDDAADAIAHATRFQAGFSRCAAEAVRFLLSSPGLDAELGRRLVRHLAARCLTPAQSRVDSSSAIPLSVRISSPPAASTPAVRLLMEAPTLHLAVPEDIGSVWRPW